MADVTHAECEGHATELMRLDERARVLRMLQLVERAVVEDAPHLPVVTAMVLRDRFHWDWAEYLFQAALRVPGATGMALFELSVLEHLRCRPDRSIAYLDRHEAHHPLNSYQQRAYAHQLGRLGDLAGASERLERAVALDPVSTDECVEIRQFCDYVQRFPLAQAQARCAGLLDTYGFLHPSELADAAGAAVREGRPWSMIRLNDGEGAYLHLSIDDEARYRALYGRNRREFHRIWHGSEDKARDPDFLAAIAEMNGVLANADCLAGYVCNSLPGEYGWGSIRNVPCLFNVARKLEQLRDLDPERTRRVSLADNYVNQFMLFHGHLDRLLAEQTRLGLVACHAGLPEALRRRFDLQDVLFHRTPGEVTANGGVELEPLRDWHPRMKGDLRARVQPGVLYLVAAGITGKVYCDLIKRGGGVALDIGSVADIWMRAPTRIFHAAADDHRLV